jgi:hypothetical protein
MAAKIAEQLLSLDFQIELLKECIMQMLITFMAVVAGLIFSVAVALLAEELIFGQVFRLFSSQRPVRVDGRQAPLKTYKNAKAQKRTAMPH